MYLEGHTNSYLDLGVSDLLKPKQGTISVWINLERFVFAGKGYEGNPIICARRSDEIDFYDAFTLFYDLKSEKLLVFFSKDSTEQAGINSNEKFEFNRWYHLAFTFNDKYSEFYINGKKQGSTIKNFETEYLKNFPVYVGNTGSTKNARRSRGTVDDIKIFHRVLTEKEIKALYTEPNPNKLKDLSIQITRYLIIALVLSIIIVIIIWRYKKIIKQQKEQFELKNKINELEIKVIKAQMNPHFISNCLAAIQELIYNNDVEKAGLYIAKFSFFIRQVLNYSDQTYINLSVEMGLIKLNVELEQLRFKDNFDFEIKISDDVNAEEILIPSLISQPFVENAIWHGLLPLKGSRKPKLTINVYSKNNFLFIEIQDNGVGRNKNKTTLKKSKGTKLVTDKLDSINKLNNNTNHKLEIIDLYDAEGEPAGTKIIIQLNNYTD